jgi:hypothetical protein
LQETKANLREALHQAGALEYKFLGPRPKDGQKEPSTPGSESIATLLSDVRFLSAELVKALCAHHVVVGDFAWEKGIGQVARLG